MPFQTSSLNGIYNNKAALWMWEKKTAKLALSVQFS